MDSMRNFIKINLFLNKLKKKQNESFSFASFFAMLNRKRRNVNGKNEECTAITAHVFGAKYFICTEYSERIDGQNRHYFFGCWLIVFYLECSG